MIVGSEKEYNTVTKIHSIVKTFRDDPDFITELCDIRIKLDRQYKNDKKNCIAKIGSNAYHDTECSHIIPKKSEYFLDNLGLDPKLLYLGNGKNIVRTTGNIHKLMELMGTNRAFLPYFTMIPLEYIKQFCDLDTFFATLREIDLVTDDPCNAQVVDNMLVVHHPGNSNKNNVVLESHNRNFFKDWNSSTAKDLDNGEFFWLIHSIYTIANWSHNDFDLNELNKEN